MRLKLAKILIGVGGLLILVHFLVYLPLFLISFLIPHTEVGQSALIAVAWLLIVIGLLGDLRVTKPIVLVGALLFIVISLFYIQESFRIVEYYSTEPLGDFASYIISEELGDFASYIICGTGLLLLSLGYRDITAVKLLVGIGGLLFAVFTPTKYSFAIIRSLLTALPSLSGSEMLWLWLLILTEFGGIFAGSGLVLFSSSLSRCFSQYT